MSNSVIIDGVPYVPDTQYANRVSFWWMHDDHTFTRLEGNTLDDVIKSAERVWTKYAHGSLCPAVLCHDRKEIRRVGKMMFHYPNKSNVWKEDLAHWRSTMEADVDVIRVLAAGGNHV